jgi:hypothetical protein
METPENVTIHDQGNSSTGKKEKEEKIIEGNEKEVL